MIIISHLYTNSVKYALSISSFDVVLKRRRYYMCITFYIYISFNRTLEGSYTRGRNCTI